MKRKRLSPTKKARSKRCKASGEKPSRKLKRTPKKKNRIRRKEREKRTRNDMSKRRISSEEQCEKEIQRRS